MFKHVCDFIFRQLNAKGVATETKVTPIITEAEEDKLWDAGVMSVNNPTALLRAVFSIIVKISICGEVWNTAI